MTERVSERAVTCSRSHSMPWSQADSGWPLPSSPGPVSSTQLWELLTWEALGLPPTSQAPWTFVIT